MYKETIKYTDFNGVERTEDFYFHLTEAELTKMQTGVTGGLTEKIKRLIAADNVPEIMVVFEELITKSYGVKSADGRGFLKRKEDLEAFMATEAYSQLYMKLITDDQAAAQFINGIVPASLAARAASLQNASPMPVPNN